MPHDLGGRLCARVEDDHSPVELKQRSAELRRRAYLSDIGLLRFSHTQATSGQFHGRCQARTLISPYVFDLTVVCW